MNSTTWKKNRTVSGLAMAPMLLGLWACTMSDSRGGGGDNGGGGVVVQVTDSTQIVLNFDSLSKTLFTASNDFDLKEIRQSIKDKGMNLSTVSVYTLKVSYETDSGTHSFIVGNLDLPFVLKVFAQYNTSDSAKLAMETRSSVPLQLNLETMLLTLNNNLFVSESGFLDIKSAIQDTTKDAIKIRADLELKAALKATGKMKLNVVVTVQGKV